MNLSISNSNHWLRLFFLTLSGLLITFIILSELLLRFIVDRYDLWEKHREVFFLKKAANVVMGDSHSANGFTGVGGFINLSYPSESVEIIELKAGEYFKNHAPQKVILQADPHMFSDYRKFREQKNIVPYYQRPGKTPLRLLSPQYKENIVAYWKAAFKLHLKSRFYFEEDGAQTSENIWPDKESGSKALESEIEERLRVLIPMKDYETSNPMNSFRNILAYFKSQNADVCLVTFPMSPLFIKRAEDFPEFRKIQAYFKNLAVQYGFKYVNQWDQVTDPNLFSNEDHLNRKGALIFSRQTNEKCFGN